MIFKVKRAQRGETKAFVELMEENRQAMRESHICVNNNRR